MTAEVFASNRAVTTVSSGGTDAPSQGAQESWTVASSTGFPAVSSSGTPPTQFHVADPAQPSEMIAVTALSGTAWTVTRGAESTTPVTHQAGFTVYQVVTTGGLGGFLQGPNNLSDLGNAGTARTNLGLGPAATIGTPVTIANGGTGHGTQQLAMDALAGAVTSGDFLRGNGTHVTMSAIQAADLPAATTSTQGAVVIDGTGTDIAPSPGTQAAGSAGKPPDAGHVHGQPPFFAPTGLAGATAASRYAGATVSGPPQSGTFSTGDWIVDQQAQAWICTAGGAQGTWIREGDQPYQFRPETYGALGNGVAVTDAVMASGSPNLACTTSNPFASGDTGKHILVSTAAGAYAHLHSTISTFTDSGHVVLAANATANTGGTPGAIAYYGSDDTAAIQSALNAAVAYAQAHNGYAEVLFSDKIYIVAGAFTVGGATLGNFQIGLPIVTATAGVQVVLGLIGVQKTTPLMHWLQVTPQASGTILASVRTDGTNNGSYGPASVIGGPVSTYGGEPGTFSNCLVRVDGIGMLVPYNATMSGLDLFGMVEADVSNFSCMTAAVVPTSSVPAPSLASASNISNQYTFGIRMPDSGNQTVCRLTAFSSEGMCYGVCPSEWATAVDVHVMYAIVAIAPWAGGVNMVHSAIILNAQCENCTNAIGPNGTGLMRIDILNLQTESISSSALVYDPSSQLQGTLHLRAQGSAGNYTSNGWLSGGSGGELLRIINELTTPGPISSPHAVAASGSPWFNGYTRDAWITLSATTITEVTITGQNGVTVTQNGLAGSPASYTLLLPSSSSYTATYTGTLTHTVTLI